MDKSVNNISGNGICKLCPKCTQNTKAHFLSTHLLLSYCECVNMGGIYIGMCDTPYWKLFSEVKKDDFFDYASSATAFVDCVRESTVRARHNPEQEQIRPNT